MILGVSAITQFSIQHATEIQDGPAYVVHANHLIDNFNAIISDFGDRLSLISGVSQTIAGPVTFTSAPTFTAGFTIASSITVTGNLVLAVATDPVSPPNGTFWYNSTSNVPKLSKQINTVTNATNASPIVITTAGLHGLTTGQTAFIASVLGNTNANGTWTVTVVDPVTFSLNTSTGNAAYTSGGTVSIPTQILTTGYIPPSSKGNRFGCIVSNNTTNPLTQLDISAGAWMDDTGVDWMVYAGGTKLLGSAWAVGTNQGSSDTGTIPTSGTVHLFLIKRPDTGVVDLYTSSNFSPTLPTNYTLKACIASWTTDGSAHLNFIKQCPVNPDRFEYMFTPQASITSITGNGTTAVATCAATLDTNYWVVGRLVTITGNGNAGFNVSSVALTAVSGSTFSFLNSTNATGSGGTGVVGNTPALDVDVTNQSTSAVTRTLNVPTGKQVTAIINAFVKCTQADLAVYFRNLDLADVVPSDSVAPLCQLIQAAGSNGAAGQLQIVTNTSGQISTRGTIPSGTAATIVKIATVGWIDTRGRAN